MRLEGPGESVRGERRRMGWLFGEVDMRDNNSPRKGKAHIWLIGLVAFLPSARIELPLGFGEVSMVYSSFMLLISYR